MEDLSGADLRDRGAEVETLPELREHILLAEEECELPGGEGKRRSAGYHVESL